MLQPHRVLAASAALQAPGCETAAELQSGSTRAHAHTCMHTQCTLTLAHEHAHTCTHSHVCTCTHACARALTHTRTHSSLSLLPCWPAGKQPVARHPFVDNRVRSEQGCLSPACPLCCCRHPRAQGGLLSQESPPHQTSLCRSHPPDTALTLSGIFSRALHGTKSRGQRRGPQGPQRPGRAWPGGSLPGSEGPGWTRLSALSLRAEACACLRNIRPHKVTSRQRQYSVSPARGPGVSARRQAPARAGWGGGGALRLCGRTPPRGALRRRWPWPP